MKTKSYIANISIEASTKELNYILEKISDLCEEKDYVKSYNIKLKIKEAVK